MIIKLLQGHFCSTVTVLYKDMRLPNDSWVSKIVVISLRITFKGICMGDTEKKKVLFSVCKADAIPLTTPSLDDHIQTHGFEFCNMWMCPNYTYLNLLLQQLACESK